jgi:arylsulfatase A-like enzyme
MPLIEGDEAGGRPVFSQWLAGGRIVALRDEEWKYIQFKRREQLFDLSGDPGETMDRSDDRRDVLLRFRQAVDEIIEESYGFAERQSPSRAPQLDPETRRQLQALGYLDADS